MADNILRGREQGVDLYEATKDLGSGVHVKKVMLVDTTGAYAGGGGGGGDATAANQTSQITLATSSNTKLDQLHTDLTTGPVIVQTDGVADSSTFSGTVSSAATLATFSVVGYQAIAIQFSSVGTSNIMRVEASNDGVVGTGSTWGAVIGQAQTTALTAPAATLNGIAAGDIYVYPVVGHTMRVRVSTYTTGTVTVAGVKKRSGLVSQFNNTGSQSTNGPIVQGAGTAATPISITPASSVAGAGIAPVATSVLASGLLVKTGACNLYSVNVQPDADGWIMLFDATSIPADGTVTPKKVWKSLAASDGRQLNFSPPLRMSTGAYVAYSSTGPFTLTASVHAFISGEAL